MNAFRYDWVVVGSGMTGASFARRKAEEGCSVLVMEKRTHIGGNCYDYYDHVNGSVIHKYGPHLFHTNSDKVVDFLTQFTYWEPYTHHVKALIDGMQVPLPINFNTIEALFPTKLATELITELITHYGYDTNVPLAIIGSDAKSPILTVFAEDMYRKVFANYSKKQWGGENLAHIDPSVMARVPVRLSKDDRYFQDKFQALPSQGYTAMFTEMLDHPNIQIMLNADFNKLIGREVPADVQVFYTGTIDSFYNYDLGSLPYRTIQFSQVTGKRFGDFGTLNTPEDMFNTRVSNQAFIHGTDTGKWSSLTYETPMEYDRDNPDHIPYYPLPTDNAKQLYRDYANRADARPNVHFAGRLGSFQYLNIDQSCAQGLHKADIL